MSLDIWLKMEVDTGGEEPYEVTLYDGNYTHNVVPMWSKAGVYDALYKSEGKTAGELLEVLEKGIAHMETNPQEYEALNPSNGWGSYEGALKFLRRFTLACKAHPKAVVGIWA